MSEHNWNLKEIFKNKEEFNIMKKSLEEDLENISTLFLLQIIRKSTRKI